MTTQPSLFADPDADVRAQLALLRKWDFRTYDPSDERQRAVVEQMLRTPLPRVKK